MGAQASAPTNNEFVDVLKGRITVDPKVVRAFRRVDRAHFFPEEIRESAYYDAPQQCMVDGGRIHFSGQGIYFMVVNAMDVQPGNSFLNVGSGSGYLSTVVGALLGPTGVNHGIEISPEVVKYAEEVQDAFVALPTYDSRVFCRPQFLACNGLHFLSLQEYDCVYCGAGVPEDKEDFLKQFVKVGGRLVYPSTGSILRLDRVSESEWKTSVAVPGTAFRELVGLEDPAPPVADNRFYFEAHFPSLLELCRKVIVENYTAPQIADMEIPETLKVFLNWGMPVAFVACSFSGCMQPQTPEKEPFRWCPERCGARYCTKQCQERDARNNFHRDYCTPKEIEAEDFVSWSPVRTPTPSASSNDEEEGEETSCTDHVVHRPRALPPQAMQWLVNQRFIPARVLEEVIGADFRVRAGDEEEEDNDDDDEEDGYRSEEEVVDAAGDAAMPAAGEEEGGWHPDGGEVSGGAGDEMGRSEGAEEAIVVEEEAAAAGGGVDAGAE